MVSILRETYYIFSGYVNLILSWFGRDPYLYRKRYAICRKCCHRDGMICSLCGCVLAAKVRSEYPISIEDGKSIGGCPDNPPRW